MSFCTRLGHTLNEINKSVVIATDYILHRYIICGQTYSNVYTAKT